MLKRATARSKANSTKSTSSSALGASPSTNATNSSSTASSSSLLFSADPNNMNGITTATSIPPPALSSYPPEDEIIERIRLKIPNAHVFKLPPKPSSGGWRGGDWRDKVWQGTLKVVERGENTAVLLVDSNEERNIFAVCPIRHNIDTTTNGGSSGSGGGGGTNSGNGVDRCIDSSRYFVLRIQNAEGRHMYIGLAFNERNDAFDFNTALEDSRREKEVERKLALGMLSCTGSGGSGMYNKVDYTMKEGEKIHVSIPKSGGGDSNYSPTNDGGDGSSPQNQQQQQTSSSAATRRREAKKSSSSATASSSLPWSLSNKKGGGVLKPSSKDTPSRLA